MCAGFMDVTSVVRVASMRHWCWTARSSSMHVLSWTPGMSSTCQPGMWPFCISHSSIYSPRSPHKTEKVIPLMSQTRAEAAPQHQAMRCRAMEQLAVTSQSQLLHMCIKRQPAQQCSAMDGMPAALQAVPQAVHQPGLKSTWYPLSPRLVQTHLPNRSNPHLQLAQTGVMQ